VLINTARGGIVDELSLAQALLEGRLFAAGLDVFSEEPVQTDNPLLDLPNVVLAPHVGSASEDTRNKMAEIAVENLRLGLASQPMLHCVNFGPFA
jgi:glyoxylate reductase